MAMIEGEPRQFGSCDLEIEDRKIEPRPDIRGVIARTYFYMDAAYPGRGVIPEKNRKLFEAWDREDPVGAWEREQVRRIEPLQGNTNPFVKRGGVMIGDRVFGRLRLAMADVTGIATPVRAQGQRFGPTCVPSEGASRAPGIAMRRRMTPWSMRNGSHQR
jgi:Endonuclease I